ncbi:hypothetical protein Pcal_0263 [Pyrobaculum calidifontis JCM 11548]|uniref:Uncharacterized protein n=2 Tax=Pyrobaculum calidifontis TaxID=181486 RepID=A3MST3_PYRCJ|nr:hypothetical protein Pcal_0263 [Pyrobaculum calidifontis JCM 11548]
MRLGARTHVPSSRTAMELVIKSWGVYLGFSRGAVVIRQRGGGERRVPIYQVDRIWILTGGVAISSKLLRVCARVYRRGGVRRDAAGAGVSAEGNGAVSHWGRCEAYFDGRGFELARGIWECRLSVWGVGEVLCTMEGPCGGLMDAAGKCLGA